MAGCEEEFPHMERLSLEAPLLISPYGTGCSRYFKVFEWGGQYLVTWQPSQPDESHALVMNRVRRSGVEEIINS